MKYLITLPAFVALALGAWEITPLVPDANIRTFNISTYNTSIWNVVPLNLTTSTSQASLSDALVSSDEEDCYTRGAEPGFCVISSDPTQCNIAVRDPSIPRPPGQETRADGYVYTHDCDMKHIRGCRLKQPRDGSWWSIYSDLKYTVEVSTYQNKYPDIAYANYKCTGLFCFGWSYVLDDPDTFGNSVYVFRHSFPCNQP